MHMQLTPYLVHYIEEAIQKFNVLVWVDWKLLAFSKEKKYFIKWIIFLLIHYPIEELEE